MAGREKWEKKRQDINFLGTQEFAARRGRGERIFHLTVKREKLQQEMRGPTIEIGEEVEKVMETQGSGFDN